MEESELIDHYVQNKLTLEEMLLVEEKLTNDKAFKRRVVLRKAIMEGIGQTYSEALKEKLTAFDRSLEENKSGNKYSWKMAAVLTSVVVVIAIVAVRYFFMDRSLEKYDLVEIGIPNTMGTESDVALANAMNDFKQGAYNVAFQDFKELLRINPANDTLLYYEGVSAFRLKNHNAAIEAFSKIVDTQSSEYAAAAEYRLGLSYLANREKQKAFEIFNAIAKTSHHTYKAQSLKILTEQF